MLQPFFDSTSNISNHLKMNIKKKNYLIVSWELRQTGTSLIKSILHYTHKITISIKIIELM